jgi:hypothetical protein
VGGRVESTSFDLEASCNHWQLVSLHRKYDFQMAIGRCEMSPSQKCFHCLYSSYNQASHTNCSRLSFAVPSPKISLMSLTQFQTIQSYRAIFYFISFPVHVVEDCRCCPRRYDIALQSIPDPLVIAIPNEQPPNPIPPNPNTHPRCDPTQPCATNLFAEILRAPLRFSKSQKSAVITNPATQRMTKLSP